MLTKYAIGDISYVVERDDEPSAPKQAKVAYICFEALMVCDGLVLRKDIVIGGKE